MGPTSQLTVIDYGRSAIRKRHQVMKVEKPAFRASSPRTDERALAVVAFQTARRTVAGMCCDPDFVVGLNTSSDVQALVMCSKCDHVRDWLLTSSCESPKV